MMKTLLSKENIKKNILLMAIWGTVIVTGFLTLGAIMVDMEGLVVFGRIHSLAVRLGLVYTVVHICRNTKQIMSCIGVKVGRNKHGEQMEVENQVPKSNRIVKVIIAVAFHIVLHIISIHLAVAYTVFHVIQHRHGIDSLSKKKSFRQNAHQMRPLQPLQFVA